MSINLNELNTLTNAIAAADEELGKKSTEPIRKELARLRNETVEAYEEVCGFLTKNFPKFIERTDRERAWEHNVVEHYDTSKLNGICRYTMTIDFLKYWVDGCLEFHVSCKDWRTVTDLYALNTKSNGRNDTIYWRNGLPQLKWEADSDRIANIPDADLQRELTDVREDHRIATEVLPQKLVKMLQKIAERTNAAIAERDAMLDSAAANGGKKTTFKIEVVTE